VLTIDATVLKAVVAHARREHPEEACGYVAGVVDSDLPTRHIPMENAARSTTRYVIDSMDQIKAFRDMESRGEEAVVIYHSHTMTEAFPSRSDVVDAGEPGAHYLLVSTRDPEYTEIRSYRIVDGVITEEPVDVINASVDPDAVQKFLFGQSPTTVDYECRAGS
jgi:proteasome lid subunit RPN8/RPN11